MTKTSLGKYNRPSKNSTLYKKSKKKIHTRSNFVVVFTLPANSDALIHMGYGYVGYGRWYLHSSVTCCTTWCKEESRIAGSTFDGGWGIRW